MNEPSLRETPEFQSILVGLIDDQRSDKSMLEHCDKMRFVSAARHVAKRIFARDVAIKLLQEGVVHPSTPEAQP